MAKGPWLGRDRICAVVAATTAREMRRQIEQALGSARTIELRLDWLRSDGERRRLFGMLRRSRIGVRAWFIATLRRRQAGGRYAGSIPAQLSALREAVRAGCRWVDLEIESASEISTFSLDLGTGDAQRILSAHDFRGTPPSPRLSRWKRELEDGCRTIRCDAIKIATQCHSLKDSLRLMRLAEGKPRVVAVPMGEIARPARILALRQGSALAYAPVATTTAPGQISLAEMKDLYRAEQIDRQTRVYGVIGDPVAHSLSPLLHNTGFQQRRIKAIYVPFLVKDLRDFLRSVEPLGIRGFSVTLPHKEKILRYLSDCDPLAEAIGAVNTVVVRNRGKLFGCNTDYVGVLRALEARMPIADSRVLIFGAGGAARAVAFALARGGASVSICARKPERAKRLARSVRGEFIPRASLRHEFFDAIVNTTPVGMHPAVNRSPFQAGELNCRLVFDTIYRPQETALLKRAAQRGLETVSGVEMFLGQGIAQWEIWLGERAPEAEMRRVVFEALQGEERARRRR